MSAQKIISKFGNMRRLALALNCPPTSVSYWKKVGFIPPRRIPEIREAAFRLGIGLTAADFIPDFTDKHQHDDAA